MTTTNLVTASMDPAYYLTTYNVNTTHVKNETAAQAINIGNLQEESSVVSVSDQGAQAAGAVSTTFTAAAGDTASLSQSFSNFVDEATTQFQLFDSSGNKIADSQGTDAQQAAYTQWQKGTLILNSDTYTAIATPDNAIGGADVSISSSNVQGTTLGVTSQLTGGDTKEYYNFSLSGSNLKLAFDAGGSQSATRVQIYNKTGGLVADSAGDAFQQANYISLTSGTGLTAASGTYSVAVSYAPSAETTQNINYNFQLYSGSNYAVAYETKVKAQPADYTAAGSVTAASKAQLYTRQAYNTIGQTAAGAINIGWLQQDKSSLNVLSQLTSADSADYYSFTLQSGDNLKFGFDTTQTATPSNFRVQVYDATGSNVIADNQGTPAQQAAYTSLTTTNGLSAKAGGYIVKISYANNAPKTSSQYAFNIFSGTTYAAEYKTIASPQTYANALLSGSVGGSSSAGMAAYLTGLSNGSTPDVISALSTIA